MKKNAITEPEEFLVHVTGDPTNITIYKETHDGESRSMVFYYDAACSRHRRRYSTYATADGCAAKLKKEIKAGGWDGLDRSNPVRSPLVRRRARGKIARSVF